MYSHVITKVSRMRSLLDFLTHGAPLARFARESSAKKFMEVGKKNLCVDILGLKGQETLPLTRSTKRWQSPSTLSEQFEGRQQ